MLDILSCTSKTLDQVIKNYDEEREKSNKDRENKEELSLS